MSDAIPGWTGNERSDGIRIFKMPNTNYWFIFPPDDRVLVNICPCCEEWLTTQRAAKLAANAVYPLEGAT